MNELNPSAARHVRASVSSYIIQWQPCPCLGWQTEWGGAECGPAHSGTWLRLLTWHCMSLGHSHGAHCQGCPWYTVWRSKGRSCPSGHFPVDFKNIEWWPMYLCLPVGALLPGPFLELLATCSFKAVSCVCTCVCCRTLGESCHFSGPWFSHLNNGYADSCLVQLFWMWQLAPCMAHSKSGSCDICPLSAIQGRGFPQAAVGSASGKREGMVGTED